MKTGTFLFVIITCIGCQPTHQKVVNDVNKSSTKDGVIKSYDKTGNLHTKITYKDGVKHGKSYLYHKGSDQVLLEMPYQYGMRQGEAIKYYEDGHIFAITHYEEDEVNGTVRLYFRNGNLKAEIPYFMSKQGLGLKEYYTNGNLKTDMPTIDIRMENSNQLLIYYFSIKECIKANFYIGSLLDNQYLIEKLPFVQILPQRDGEAVYEVPNTRIGETINVICKCQTVTGKNPYVTREVFQLGK